MIRIRKEDRKKGFTLVELIVVLVILAILIGLLVPALTGYIDKAREKKGYAELNLVVKAAKAAYTEVYAEYDVEEGVYYPIGGAGENGKAFAEELEQLLGTDIDMKNIVSIAINEKQNVMGVSYKRDGRTYTYSEVPGKEPQYSVR